VAGVHKPAICLEQLQAALSDHYLALSPKENNKVRAKNPPDVSHPQPHSFAHITKLIYGTVVTINLLAANEEELYRW
jgi:hypothetical protein